MYPTVAPQFPVLYACVLVTPVYRDLNLYRWCGCGNGNPLYFSGPSRVPFEMPDLSVTAATRLKSEPAQKGVQALKTVVRSVDCKYKNAGVVHTGEDPYIRFVRTIAKTEVGIVRGEIEHKSKQSTEKEIADEG